MFNTDRMRVGDLLAGTWVISAPRKKLAVDLARHERPRRAGRFTEAQLDVYGVFELQTLEQVLRDGQPRRSPPSPTRSAHKVGLPDDGDDYGFLSDYYAALVREAGARLAVRPPPRDQMGKLRRAGQRRWEITHLTPSGS